MAEENRTPDKKIGEIQHAEEQTKRTTGHFQTTRQRSRRSNVWSADKPSKSSF